jgi:hypothetical protein
MLSFGVIWPKCDWKLISACISLTCHYNSIRYLSGSMKTWITVNLLFLLLDIPDVPGNILDPKDYCSDCDCLQFTLLLSENWLNRVVTCEIVSLLDCQILYLLWSPKISLLRFKEFVTWPHPVGDASGPRPQTP